MGEKRIFAPPKPSCFVKFHPRESRCSAYRERICKSQGGAVSPIVRRCFRTRYYPFLMSVNLPAKLMVRPVRANEMHNPRLVSETTF